MSTPSGFLSPVWAGTEVADLTSDAALLSSLLEVEAAWADVLADAGAAPRADAEAVRAMSSGPRGCGAGCGADRGRRGRRRQPGDPPAEGDAQRLGRPWGLRRSAAPGRQSQDVLDTAVVLIAHRVGRSILRDAVAIGDALSELAPDSPQHGVRGAVAGPARRTAHQLWSADRRRLAGRHLPCGRSP